MLIDVDLPVQGPEMQGGMRDGDGGRRDGWGDGRRDGRGDGWRDGRRRPDDFRRFPRRFPRRPFVPVPIVIRPGYDPCYTYDKYGRCCDRYGRCCDRFGRCDYIYDDYYGYPVMAEYDMDIDDFE